MCGDYSHKATNALYGLLGLVLSDFYKHGYIDYCFSLLFRCYSFVDNIDLKGKM